MRLSLGTIIVLALVCAHSASAQRKQRPQFGGAIEWRGQVGAVADSQDRRTGLAVRVVADGTWMRYVGWRAEGAYIQAQYDRTAETGKVPITENGYELGGFLRSAHQGTKWAPYVLGGSVLSLRGSCNLDNGFSYDAEIRCDDATTIRVGWGAGAGIRLRAGLAGWDWFMETRVLGNVTSASGGRLIAIAFGAGM